MKKDALMSSFNQLLNISLNIVYDVEEHCLQWTNTTNARANRFSSEKRHLLLAALETNIGCLNELIDIVLLLQKQVRVNFFFTKAQGPIS